MHDVAVALGVGAMAKQAGAASQSTDQHGPVVASLVV